MCGRPGRLLHGAVTSVEGAAHAASLGEGEEHMTNCRGTLRCRLLVPVVIALSLAAGCSGSVDPARDGVSPTSGQGSSALASASSAVASASSSVTQATAKLCSTLGELKGSLQTASEQGVAPNGQLSVTLSSFATTLETAATSLNAVNANDAADAATSLAADIKTLATGAGDKAKAAAAGAAVKVDALSAKVRCTGS
jgi:hypothetical protein